MHTRVHCDFTVPITCRLQLVEAVFQSVFVVCTVIDWDLALVWQKSFECSRFVMGLGDVDEIVDLGLENIIVVGPLTVA